MKQFAIRNKKSGHYSILISVMKLARVATVIISLSPFIVITEAATNQTDFTIDARMRSEIIEKVLRILNERYVFPAVAKQMEDAIREGVRRKEYDDTTSANTFAKLLTYHLREVSHDKHIIIESSFDSIPESNEVEETPQDREIARARKRQEESQINYGFDKLEILSGNVGYLDMSVFCPAEFGGETAVAAMAFLNNTDALIIDLRDNDGGSPDMVALLTSYLFDKGPIHLTGIYWRKDNRIQESWTLPYLPGKKYVGKNVYILTSKDGTSSAAEAFVYNLKILKRAIVIGETTAGAANPGGTIRLNEHFTIFVPTGRAFNPITKSNWEGVGIPPDIEVPAATALKIAHIEAIKAIESSTLDQARNKYLRRLITAEEKKQQ